MEYGTLLHDGSDEYGPIRVLDDGQYRVLSFAKGDEQSRIKLSAPHILQHEYTQAMMLVLLFIQPKRICLLGLGGGTLLHALYHAIPNVNITAIELRQGVLDVAKEFFRLPQGKRISLQLANAVDYLKDNQSKKVDILMTDLYNTEGMDSAVLQSGFIHDCACQIKESGWLVLNCWNDQENNEDLIFILKMHFSDIRALNTGTGNWVVFAGKRGNLDSTKTLKSHAQKLSLQLGIPLNKWLTRLKEM